MAIYHLSAHLIKRSQGQSSTAAAAYRAGVSLTDERTGVAHDYQRKRGVSHEEILAPESAPDWAYDRSQLWNTVEQVERRQDAQLAREIEIALPRELSEASMHSLVKDFAQTHFVERGMIADIAFHHLDSHNPHAHILLTTRDIDGSGFGKKNRSWNDKSQLQDWRSGWQHCANQALEKEGHSARIDHRSLAEQGQDRLPTKHMGHRATALERRGVETERGDYNRKIERINERVQSVLQHPDVVDYHQLPQHLPELKALFMAGVEHYLAPKLAQADRLSQTLDQKIEHQETKLVTHRQAHPDHSPSLLSRLKQKAHEKAKDLWQRSHDALHGRLYSLKHRLSRVTDYVRGVGGQPSQAERDAANKYSKERPALTLKLSEEIQKERAVKQAELDKQLAERRARGKDKDLDLER